MRQIKFRAFDPKNGMIEPYSVRHGKAFIIKRCSKDDPTVKVDGVNFYCNWDIDVATDFPIMQFTGLKDVNGVEIYEGDIVHWGHIKGYEEYLPRKAVVEFSPDLTFSTFNLENNHKFRFGCFSYRNTNNAVEVIGNIHQNPELLK